MTLLDALPAALLRYPGQRVREFGAAGVCRDISFAELHDDINALTAQLRSANVGARTRVGILGDHGYNWLLADLATIGIDAISVPIPAEHDRETVTQIFDDHHLDALLIIGDADTTFTTQHAAAHHHGIAIHIRPRPATTHTELDPDGFTLAYSSGSTGIPKAILMSKRGVAHTIDVASAAWHVDNTDNVLIAIPFTGFQQRYLVYLAIHAGAGITITTPELMYRALKELNPTFLLGPPSFFDIVTDRLKADNARGRRRYRLIDALAALPGEALTRPLRAALARPWTQIYGTRMRILIASSAPIAGEVVNEFWKLGQPLYETYGSTELGWIALATRRSHRPGTAGPPVPGISIMIDDDDEILARAHHPMGIAYLSDDGHGLIPFPTRPGGYIATGDTGTLSHGVLTVTGRKKNIIITTSGMKINAESIETRVESHPAVVKAVVATAPGSRLLTCVAWIRDATEDGIAGHIAAINERSPAANRIETVHVRPHQELTIESGLLTHPYKKVNRPAVHALIAELSKPVAAQNPAAENADQTLLELVRSTLATVTGDSRPIGVQERLRADLGIDSVALMSAIFLLDEQIGLGTPQLVIELSAADTVSDIVASLQKLGAHPKPDSTR